MTAGRAAGRNNAIRIDAQLGGMLPQPADGAFGVFHALFRRRRRAGSSRDNRPGPPPCRGLPGARLASQTAKSCRPSNRRQRRTRSPAACRLPSSPAGSERPSPAWPAAFACIQTFWSSRRRLARPPASVPTQPIPARPTPDMTNGKKAGSWVQRLQLQSDFSPGDRPASKIPRTPGRRREVSYLPRRQSRSGFPA